jgi:ATP-dependent helicase/nuclease subunit B
MDPFVDQLARLVVEHRTRAKWVFVPTHAIGRTIGERIALGGTNWLNLRFVTPLDIALRMGSPFLVERGIDPSEDGLGPALIMRLLLELPKKHGYFRPLAAQPTMAQALWSTIRELRMAGVKSGDLKADTFETPRKHAELSALLAAYEQFLTTNHRGDMAAVYIEAVKHLDWCPIQPPDCWTELPGAIWTPLQRQVIDVMPGERIKPRALVLPGVSLPRRIQQVDSGQPRAARVDGVAPDAATNPLAFFMDPCANTHGSSGAGTSSIALFHAGGREAEIEEVFRRILAAGVPLDQVEIASASDAHVALVWEKALRHDWPVTLGPGIPATSTRPGRALIGLCDWIETDFSAAHLRHLLQSGDMGLEKDDEGFTAGEAARLLARAEAGWGRATYGLALGMVGKSYESRANDPDLSDDDRVAARQKQELTSAVLKWISKVIASVPEADAAGRVPLQAVVEGVFEYLDRSTARSSQLDHRAAAALGDFIGELRALGSFSCTQTEALRFIRERVQSLQVAPERPRPGSLFVCTFSQAGYSGRPHLFVVGLEEGRVFPSATEDAVLLDAERAAISPALRRSTDKIDEAVHGLLARLATYGKESRITFSYSVRDTREFRETYASWVMLQAYRLQQGDEALSYQHMKAALGEPASSLPATLDRASSASAWWLRAVVGTGTSGVSAVEGVFSAVAQGRKAEAERASDRFTEFDGDVPDAGKVLDPCAPANAFSVTELEGAAGCPFRLFLKRGLGLRPVDARERDKDVWLDPLTRGSELHDIYASALRRCRDAKRRPDPKKDGAWLLKLAQDRLNELRREMPPATVEIFERESKDFLADVELFLEGECGGAQSEPLGFEVSFGRPLGEEEEALARAEPVEIDLGGGLAFRIAGRIDRIDKVGPAAFEILDYKTGGYWRGDFTGTFRGGRRLQHALYGLAAVELLRTRYKNPKVTGGVYYFSSHKGGQERIRIPAPKPQDMAAVLGDLRELLVKGAFVHTPDDRDCKFCDYKPACTSDVNVQAKAKLADAKLNAYGRLAAHV